MFKDNNYWRIILQCLSNAPSCLYPPILCPKYFSLFFSSFPHFLSFPCNCFLASSVFFHRYFTPSTPAVIIDTGGCSKLNWTDDRAWLRFSETILRDRRSHSAWKLTYHTYLEKIDWKTWIDSPWEQIIPGWPKLIWITCMRKNLYVFDLSHSFSARVTAKSLLEESNLEKGCDDSQTNKIHLKLPTCTYSQIYKGDLEKKLWFWIKNTNTICHE